MTEANRKIIAENVTHIRRQIADAAERAGRSSEEVKLVAVSKYVGEEEIRDLLSAGCTIFGENRPQVLSEKVETIKDPSIRWHMIGHLQRNKVRRVVPLVSMIESVDSQRLIAAIDRVAEELGLCVPVLLEVNISGDVNKHGFAPEELHALVQSLGEYRHVDVRGLMAMASLVGGTETARADFAAVRRLRDQLQKVCSEGVNLAELSMGMSGDFEVAVEEGATMVRIGSALFEGTN